MVERLDRAAKIRTFQERQMGLVLLEWRVYQPMSDCCRKLTQLRTYRHQMVARKNETTKS